jgi:trans-2,3-dihydro-3-hydroxyanthranilate isomerase
MSECVLRYWHVDVFSARPLSGNGLTIFPLETPLPPSLMQRITQEMRQFESIFLCRTEHPRRYEAWIFTMEEELGFAGHPIIGAASAVHAADFLQESEIALEFVLAGRVISVVSRRQDGRYRAWMDQGLAQFGPPLDTDSHADVLAALNLDRSALAADAPMQVVSTGLPYLIVPVEAALARSRIVVADFEARLERLGAKFVYVLDIARREGRTWDNAGLVEDIATGSAAGPAAAYLVRHGFARSDEPIVLHQGAWLDRPSELHVRVEGDRELQVVVAGDVCAVANGELRLPMVLLP